MTIELWAEVVGTKPHRVWVGERADKKLAVYLRWYEDGKPRYQRAKVQTIRDARSRPLERAKEQARAEARDKAGELAGERVATARVRARPLTLSEGVALAFGPTGPYHLDPKKDGYTRAAKSAAADAVELLGGGDVLWEEVTPGMVRSIWRKIARRKEHEDGSGYNKAEKIVIVFYRIAGWLQGERPNDRFPAPLKGWRKELKEHWAKQGHAIEPHQPRYTTEEIAKLFAHIREADPRLLLALVLGGELRGGQVMRTWRSHCDLSEGAGAGWGVVQIPFVSARKRAPRLPLNEIERAALDAAMQTGYLSVLEAAFQRGEIKDYPLFPGGKLRKGKAPVRAELKTVHNTSLPAMLHDLEAAAKVEPMPGRAWHGLRRSFTDLYPKETTDARLLDQLGGWAQGSIMREAVYQQKESDEVANEAARLRARVRQTLLGEGFQP